MTCFPALVSAPILLPMIQKMKESGRATRMGSRLPQLSEMTTGFKESQAKEIQPAVMESRPAARVFLPLYISAISTGTKPVDIHKLDMRTKASYTRVKRKARQTPIMPKSTAPKRLRLTSLRSLICSCAKSLA